VQFTFDQSAEVGSEPGLATHSDQVLG